MNNRTKFNINQYVYIRLTEFGKKELNKIYTNWQPEPDKNGYIKMQLHEVMLIFGHLMYCGCNVPFETNIYFESKENV